MKSTDYKTEEQASAYANYRFQRGLSAVSHDELNLLKNWLVRLEKNLIFTDLGSGTGRVLTVLLNCSPKKIFPVDQSLAMLSQLRNKFEEHVKNNHIEIIAKSSDNTGIKANSIDVVTAFHLVKHLPKPERTYKEVSRILKKGGIFIFDALNESSIISLNLGSCHATNESFLKSQLSNYGLTVENVVFLHPFGETIYNLPTIFLPLIKLSEMALSLFIPKAGTKIFILAKKI